jgi:flagella basal body P-ring formation protein FlgA
VGDVELLGSGVAAENGLKDEVIRVINQESHHAFRARVVGSGEVEVVDVR